ncbi:tetratricopeptide repeat protein [Gelidibacter pelagius]|nr:tetratricopeptide repeat protein [Gelidibacter pelagius]
MNFTYKLCLVILIFMSFINCKNQAEAREDAIEVESSESKVNQQKQDTIIYETLSNASDYHLYSQEYQLELDKGLARDSTIAYLWQQKAMPLFKQGKYEAGMIYIDNAVKYDRRRYQDYRAFIKCIFAKTYREAIIDFEDYKKRFGDSYVMDHTYDFHIALSYLQLNEFKKAEDIFERDYQKQLAEHGKDWLHSVDLFYYGISKYEQGKYHDAIEMFDLALGIYNNFSDVQYYKAICLSKIGKIGESDELHELAEINGKKGYTFNEDNVIYERYPYQVRWR